MARSGKHADGVVSATRWLRHTVASGNAVTSLDINWCAIHGSAHGESLLGTGHFGVERSLDSMWFISSVSNWMNSVSSNHVGLSLSHLSLSVSSNGSATEASDGKESLLGVGDVFHLSQSVNF